MGLRDALQAPARPEFPRIDAIRNELDADDLAVFEAALVDLSVPAERLATALTAEGHPVGASTIKRWRQRNGIE